MGADMKDEELRFCLVLIRFQVLGLTVVSHQPLQ